MIYLVESSAKSIQTITGKVILDGLFHYPTFQAMLCVVGSVQSMGEPSSYPSWFQLKISAMSMGKRSMVNAVAGQ